VSAATGRERKAGLRPRLLFARLVLHAPILRPAFSLRLTDWKT